MQLTELGKLPGVQPRGLDSPLKFFSFYCWYDVGMEGRKRALGKIGVGESKKSSWPVFGNSKVNH